MIRLRDDVRLKQPLRSLEFALSLKNHDLLLGQCGFLEYLKHDPSVADSDVTPDYCAKNNWIVGSPATKAASARPS